MKPTESRAYKEFVNAHARGQKMALLSIQLLKVINKLEHEPTIEEYNESEYISDSGRAGIVTAVAAFDRYFTTRFAECITPILQHEGPNNELIELLSKAGLDLKGALELLHADRPYRKIRNLIGDHLSEVTTQTFHVIDELFKTIGLSEFTLHVERKAQRKQLRTSIQKLVKRRHAIVHDGDLNAYGRLVPINHKDTVKRIEQIKIFVENAEKIICNRMARCKAKK